MTQAQARAEFRRQTQVWRSGTKPAMAAAASESAPQTDAAPKGRLQLLAPGEAEGSADQAANQQASSEAASGGEAAGGVAGGSSEGTSEQSAQLRAKVEQLQQQVQDMERLAQLKDDQLAALQAQLQALRNNTGAEAAPEAASAQTAEPAQEQTPEQAGQAAPVPSEPAAAEAEASDLQGQPAAESAPAEAESQTDADAPASNRFGPVVEAKRAAPDQAQNPYAVEGYQPVDLSGLPNTPVAQPFHDVAPVPAAPEPTAKAPEAAGEPSMMDQVNAWWQKSVSLFRDNPLYLGVAIAVFVVLLLALLAARQRRRAAAGFGESILQPAPSPAPETDPSLAAAAATGAVAATAEADSRESEAEPESSYISDFSISGIDSAIESEVSEADPLTEADVFLAYGRYQPAENMIKEAIDNEPDRLDLKIKLLEVYYAARNGEAFEREAQTVHGLVEDHSDPAWQKVMEMGRDLRPDSPLFDESAAASVADEDDFSSTDNEFEFPEDSAISAKSNDNMIDFDLGDLEQFGQPENAESGSEQAEVTAADSMPREDASDGLANSVADELSELAGAMGVDRRAPEGEQNADVADFDLGDLNLDPENDQAYLNQPEPGEEQDEDVVDGGLLADGDEVGTKLDLARAYIDMGDPDGARSILDEVLEEGSEDQKNEAQGLMAHMA